MIKFKREARQQQQSGATYEMKPLPAEPDVIPRLECCQQISECNPDCVRRLVTGQGQGAGLGHGQEPTYDDSPPPLAARHESLQTSAVTGGYYYADQAMGGAVMDTRRFREQNFHTLTCFWLFSAYIIS